MPNIYPYFITDHQAYSSSLATIACYDNGDLKAVHFEDKPPEPEINPNALLGERRWLKVAMAFISYGVMSVVFDWLWVDDMLRCQMIDIIEKTFYNDEMMMGETLSQILSLFIEEIPQITLKLMQKQLGFRKKLLKHQCLHITVTAIPATTVFEE
ncbi:hypothetical protein CAPTEDRAFT_199417 [Capitella teleta]|uniref:Uncharacterized protein n=1 Tax=Capitella teleta TaxID=283909 RepID=R7VDP0_CAPTE|nr:hypothetical protein CAPTEDRAFT_199417 [Capitella teleta]|eukprot:ELU16662.1 hypothetical protein CAPTEDRAFT_199417 [Capitella teleta]